MLFSRISAHLPISTLMTVAAYNELLEAHEGTNKNIFKRLPFRSVHQF